MSIANQHIVTNPCLDANVSLGIDEACFSIINEYDTPVALYSYPSECYLVNLYIYLTGKIFY